VPCQDANHAIELANGTLIAAVADGAGSALHADEGADLAVKTVVPALRGALERGEPAAEDTAAWRQLFCDAFERARQAVTGRAAERGINVRELASTLTCAVVTGRMLAVAQIGDGFCVFRAPDGRFSLAVLPDRGEYANETTFLVSPGAVESPMVVCDPQPVRSLILATDGLLRLAFKLPGYEPYAPFFEPIVNVIEGLPDDADEAAVRGRLEALLDSDRVNARTDDDKTLVIATRIGGARANAAPPLNSEAVTTERSTDAAGDARQGTNALP
jgi:hypothetical protein